MSSNLLTLISLAYLTLLFFVAFYFKKHKSFSNSPWAYALSICVYCTAWTFYGSIGRSSVSGFGYLPVYLGPTLIAPLMLVILTKTIKISKYLRISSIADFISSRYGKSNALGALVTFLCILIAIPYISIQLKALNLSFALLSNSNSASIFSTSQISLDPALIFGLACALISIIFGTIKASPTDRHPGIISVVALESIIKLGAFLIGAFIIVYYLNDGIGSIFQNYYDSGLNNELLSFKKLTSNGNQWFWITFISAFAFLLLPRQFHLAVVENKEVKHVSLASWFVPFYLLAISILVVPVALAGNIKYGLHQNPDNFLTDLLLSDGFIKMAVIVFIGGLAASTGMIISSLMSLSIMVSNHIFLPLILKLRATTFSKMEDRLIDFRRLLIVVILVLSYGFYKIYSTNYSLVSIGLISFVGISQLIPAFLLGLYWKYANARGALAGIIVGTLLWGFTLPLGNLAEIGLLNPEILENGIFNLGIFRPQALMGITSMDPISHSCFWSLSANLICTCIVSLYTNRNSLEIAQADVFLNPDKYISQNMVNMYSREADFSELKNVLNRILGKTKVDRLLKKYLKDNNLESFEEYADTALIQYLENYLSGSIGSPSAKVILNNIVKNEPVQTQQLFKVLDQTNQLYEYSKELEEKRDELNQKTDQLFEANDKLKVLDQLKGEFVSNVTHELRTPLTSITSLADILNRYDLDEEERIKTIQTIKEESVRISKLVNQVLDLRKLEFNPQVFVESVNVRTIVDRVLNLKRIDVGNKKISVSGSDIMVRTDQGKLSQVLLNIISNAIKFTEDDGKIDINLSVNEDSFKIEISDDGIGIPDAELDRIFERFYQANNSDLAKFKGSGLGLAISKALVELLNGKISVTSFEGFKTTFTIQLENFH